MTKSREITFEITEEIGVLSTSSKGWTKELNIVSWNNGKPKFDLREWDSEHEKMGKGVTMTVEEAQALRELLDKYFNGEMF